MSDPSSDAMDLEIKDATFQAIKFREVGSERIRLEVDMTAERFRSLLQNQHGRVFVFEFCRFDAETGKAVVEFVPGNGVCRVQNIGEQS